MTEKELLKKLLEADGRGLSETESAQLDAGLHRTDFVKSAIAILPEEDVNLAWRSALNQKLLAESRKRDRARRRSWVWRPALAFGLAGALALSFFMRPANRDSSAFQSPGVEAAMVDAHRESVQATLVAGHGLTSIESRPTTATPDNFVPWDESDLGDL